MYIRAPAASGARCPRICRQCTVHDYLGLWNVASLDRIHHALVKCREKAAREASPTACIIDSQSVKSAEKGGRIDSHGFDAGKLIKGKKRHVVVDTQGVEGCTASSPPPTFRIATAVRAAGDDSVCLISGNCSPTSFRGRFSPRPGDGILPDRRDRDRQAIRSGKASKSAQALGGRTHHRWLNRCRRLAKDWENLNRNALAFIKSRPFDSCSEVLVILHIGRTWIPRP